MIDLSHVYHALTLLFTPEVGIVILCSAMYGLFVGSMPGLTATMAAALLVPVTFFMDPVPALAAMVTMEAMAIFSGDIPATLIRIPGTPSSAAYIDDSFTLTKQGKASYVLGIDVTFSVIGGIFGAIVLIFLAPILAEFALKFSSFEYFWLACVGLSCAVMVSSAPLVKALLSLLIGLMINCIGMDITLGHPRFTFGVIDLLNGFNFIPAMIGMFGIAEVMRNVTVQDSKIGPIMIQGGNIFKGVGAVFAKYWKQVFRAGAVGTIIGILPGAGADIAAWVSYGFAKKFSKEPEKFGTGHVEGLVNATTANNASLGGAWVPALVFGIPGDSITAIIIGVLFMKNLRPGPDIFERSPEIIYAVYLTFIIANLLLIPLGWLAIKISTKMLRVPRNFLYPVILIFCMVGSFAINNTNFDIIIMLGLGILAYLMENNDIPVAPAILGMVLGDLLEESFMTSMMKTDGDMMVFFERPVAGSLGAIAFLIWFSPIIISMIKKHLLKKTAT